jgi:DNA-directed RNA polymerase specialized sigma24 family protein
MNGHDWLAERFEAHRAHLRAVAYRMLGSLSEADDAVQEAWLRLSRSEVSGIENLGGWLTTVVARVCLNLLRSRNSRREQPLGVHMPDPVVSRADGRSRSWASPSGTERSSQSTCSPTPPASASSTWRPGPTDEPTYAAAHVTFGTSGPDQEPRGEGPALELGQPTAP